MGGLCPRREQAATDDGRDDGGDAADDDDPRAGEIWAATDDGRHDGDDEDDPRDDGAEISPYSPRRDETLMSPAPAWGRSTEAARQRLIEAGRATFSGEFAPQDS